MSDTEQRLLEKARYAHNAMKAEGLILSDEVGAATCIASMIYAAMEIASENRLCRHCIQKLLIDVLHTVSEAPTRLDDA